MNWEQAWRQISSSYLGSLGYMMIYVNYILYIQIYIQTSMYRYVCTCLHQPQTTAVAHWQRWPKCAPHLKPIWRSESPSVKKKMKDLANLGSMNVMQDIGTRITIMWELQTLRKPCVLTLDSTLRVQLHARAPLPKNSTIAWPSYDFMTLYPTDPTDPTDPTVDWAWRWPLLQARYACCVHLNWTRPREGSNCTSALQRQLLTIASVASLLLSTSMLHLNKHK